MSNQNQPDTSLETDSLVSETDERKIHFGKVDYSKTQNLRFYANHVAANATLFELRLVFSDVDIVNNGVSAVQTVNVLMSPELATLAYTVLGRSLDNYKKRYGGTRLPTGATETTMSD